MKKIIIPFGLALILAIWVTTFHSSDLTSVGLVWDNLPFSNQLGIAYAQSRHVLTTQAVASYNEQQLAAIKTVQSNLQLNEVEIQALVQQDLAGLQGAEKPPQEINQPKLIQTRTPNPVEARQTQNYLAMTQTHQVALSQLQPASQDDFNGAKIYSYGSLIGKQYLITIQLTSDVKGKYYAKMMDSWMEASFKCNTTKAHPDRLYCNGKSVRGGERSIYVYELGTDKLVFVGEILLPRWTPTVVWPSPCPCCKNCY